MAGQISLKRQAEVLYDNHVRPLEAEHLGEFIAVSADGRTVLDSSLREVARKARKRLGAGSFVFKIGERTVGHWR